MLHESVTLLLARESSETNHQIEALCMLTARALGRDLDTHAGQGAQQTESTAHFFNLVVLVRVVHWVTFWHQLRQLSTKTAA